MQAQGEEVTIVRNGFSDGRRPTFQGFSDGD
jgi:hypothetical protein